MPDLPQDPIARIETEVIRLRGRSAHLEAELKEARRQLRQQRAVTRARGEKLSAEAEDTRPN